MCWRKSVIAPNKEGSASVVPTTATMSCLMPHIDLRKDDNPYSSPVAESRKVSSPRSSTDSVRGKRVCICFALGVLAYQLLFLVLAPRLPFSIGLFSAWYQIIALGIPLLLSLLLVGATVVLRACTPLHVIIAVLVIWLFTFLHYVIIRWACAYALT